MHNIGLSLLVPEARYAELAAWAERTHLGARLVYYPVRAAVAVAAGQHSLQPHSLVRKLSIKKSPFYHWIEAELGRRFDYACCENLEQFRRKKLAMTRTGQIKAGGELHEKDDRHHLNDQSRYVLGWSNDAKSAALIRQERDVTTRLKAHSVQISTLKEQVAAHNTLLGH